MAVARLLPVLVNARVGDVIMQDEQKILTEQSAVVVRFATRPDLPHIAHIARITWDATYNDTIAPENRREFLERAYKVENLEDALDAAGHWFYVAEYQQTIVGFGHFLKRYHPTQSRAELVRLYVLPSHQNLNIGHTILQTGFDALARANVEQCFVSVQSNNHSARRFYERHGFKFRGSHGQFLGTQIITLVEYVRPITPVDLQP
jgi:ribosomal protein S18 acetylase RimI-like enzyme